MDELEMLQQAQTGLEAAIIEAEAARTILLKEQALNESIERQRESLIAEQAELETLRESLGLLLEKKNTAIRSTGSALAGRMAKWLPEGGEAVFNISIDGAVYIGLKKAGVLRSYDSLSGGEKAIFTVALQNSLIPENQEALDVLEAGEVDSENLRCFVSKVAESRPNAQLLINTWHRSPLPEDWKEVTL